MYMAAIKEELYNYQSLDGKDMLEDFIKDMMLIINVPLKEGFELTITNAINWYPDHPLLQQFRALCVTSYESNIFHLNVGVMIANRFKSLFMPTYPNGALWDTTWNRMVADSLAEKELEDEDIVMRR
jgi:hypothetical protein